MRNSLAALFLMLAALAQAAPKVGGIRSSTEESRSRIVVDLDRPGDYRLSTRSDPDRLVIDLAGGSFACSTSPRLIGDARVKRIRCNRLNRGAQVVLDLKAPFRYKTFVLEAVPGKKPYRIVIDVLSGLRRSGGPLQASTYPRELVVVIDPGHGGSDPGALRGDLVEKEIVLDIARRMKRLLDSTPGYRAVLTRSGDETATLYQRRDRAEHSGGDLFVSIHCNTAPLAGARGMEIFYLSLRGASDRKAQVLADKENRADRLGGVLGGNRRAEVKLVLDERMRTLMRRSYLFAKEAHLLARKTPGLKSRGVKRAGFAVCKNLDMPSILVETGFLSNRADRVLLGSEDGRQRVAEFLALSAQAYFKKNASTLDDPLFSDRDKLVYRVHRGDNLTRISRRFGVDLEALAETNHLDPKRPLRSGQRLVVLGDQRGLVHVVKRGESLASIAGRYGCSLERLMRLNGIDDANRIREGQELRVGAPRTERIVHRVRPGENLSLIAERYGVSLKQLMRDNGLKSPNRIRVGQELVVGEKPGG